MKELYDDYWRRRMEASSGLHGALKSNSECILALLPGQRLSGRVLDAGCGDGSLLFYFKERLGFEFDSYGVDISEIAVRFAKDRGVEAKVADVTKQIPFPDSFFDVVICVEVLEHLTLPENALREIIRVAKDKASVIFSTPNITHIFNRLTLLLGRSFFEKGRFSSNEHLHFWTKDSFRQFLERNGFVVTKIIARTFRQGKLSRLLRKDTLVAHNFFYLCQSASRVKSLSSDQPG